MKRIIALFMLSVVFALNTPLPVETPEVKENSENSILSSEKEIQIESFEFKVSNCSEIDLAACSGDLGQLVLKVPEKEQKPIILQRNIHKVVSPDSYNYRNARDGLSYS